MSALEQLQDEARKRPDDPQTWCRLARALVEAGHHDAAREALNRARAIPSSTALDYVFIGAVYQMLADLSHAMSAYRRAIALDRRQLEAHEALGRLLLDAGDPRAAALILRVAVGVHQESAVLHGLLALALERSGQLADALRHASRAAHLEPGDLEARRMAARIHEERGEHDACIAALRELVKVSPNDFASASWLGAKLSIAGARTEAVQILERAMSIAPQAWEAQLGLGTALLHAGAVALAIKCLKEAVRIKPNGSEGHLQLGLAFEAAGATQDAIACLRTATRLSPESARAFHRLGLALKKTGDLTNAMTALVKAAANAPEDREIHEALAEVAAEKRLHASGSIPQFPVGESSLGSFGGDLAIFALPEMLEFFGNQMTTGSVRIVSKAGEGIVELYRGRVVRIRAPRSRSVGQILEDADAITATDMKHVLNGDVDPKDDTLVAKRLIERGQIDKRVITEAFMKQAQEALLELIGWKEGQVSFSKMIENQDRVEPELTFDTRFLMLEVMRQMDEMARGPGEE